MPLDPSHSMTDPVQSLRLQIQKLRTLHAQGELGDAELHSRCGPLERQLIDLVVAQPTAVAPARAGAKLTLTLGGLVVSLAAAGYLWTGSPGTPAQPFSKRAAAASAPQAADSGTAREISREQIVAMTERLSARLQQTPEDAEGWRMLGRAQMALEQPEQAVRAYEVVTRLMPKDAGALADYADALAVRNGRDLKGEPTRLIEQALELDPVHMKSLILAGTAAFNRGDFANAVAYWDRAGAVGPADDPMAQQARAAAAEAREAGTRPPPTRNAVAAPANPATTVPSNTSMNSGSPAASSTRAQVSGTVTLAPALRALVVADDTVYIFARSADGARMPLAILRKQVRDLPYAFTLDDSHAMSPATRLSTVQSVVVAARISKSGQAVAQPGDLEGITAPVAVGSNAVRVEVSRVIGAAAPS